MGGLLCRLVLKLLLLLLFVVEVIVGVIMFVLLIGGVVDVMLGSVFWLCSLVRVCMKFLVKFFCLLVIFLGYRNWVGVGVVVMCLLLDWIIRCFSLGDVSLSSFMLGEVSRFEFLVWRCGFRLFIGLVRFRVMFCLRILGLL